MLLPLLLVSATACLAASPPRKNITTISQESVRGGAVHGGGRLSLINYRFNHHRRPRKKHLDVGELKMILGSSYDPRFMAVEEPRRGREEPGRGDGWRLAERMLRDAGNLTQQLRGLAGEGTPFGPEHVRVVEKWLIKKASCPVRYAWEDIGALFWPRYIRRGECPSSEPGTCSWPPGMHCVPSGTTTLHVLRWQCRTPRGRARKEDRPLKCKWVRVPYPVTTECMCTC